MSESLATEPTVDAGQGRDSVRRHGFTPRIGGEELSADRATLQAVDPTTESILAEISLPDGNDVDRAVAVAGRAARRWGRLHWRERAEYLERFAAVIDEHADELTLLDTYDAGLPIGTARKDVSDAAATMRYFAGLGGEVAGRAFPWTPGEPFVHTSREPYGVVGKIVPFNHPFKFATGKSASALIAGNAVIVKPSEHSSLSALRAAELAEGVLPDGLYTVLPGAGDIGGALVTHPQVPRLSFTGSVPTGQRVLRDAADGIKHVTTELGGKNPMLVFPDADPVEAARAAVRSLDLYRSPGQACWSTSRVLVHRCVREPFLEEVVRLVEAIRVGDPANPANDFGPLTYAAHHARVNGFIQAATQAGATRLVGGGRPDGCPAGYFVEPTVFADVTSNMEIAREEVFGPVLAVLDWDEPGDAIALANSLPYGLTASVWCGDTAMGQSVARELEAGVVWVNTGSQRPIGTPFGGYKRSGVGKEGNLEEVVSYTQEKAIVVGTNPAPGLRD